MSLSVTERVCGGVQLLSAQKSINGPGLWKGTFAVFQTLATGGKVWGGWQTSVQKSTASPSSPHDPTSRGCELLKTECVCVGGGALHAETAQSSLSVIFRLAIGGLSSVILNS